MEPLYLAFGIGVAIGAYLMRKSNNVVLSQEEKPGQLENIISKEKSSIPMVEIATYH